jgi:subtilase family serine protease
MNKKSLLLSFVLSSCMFGVVSIAHAQSVLPDNFGGTIVGLVQHALVNADPVVAKDQEIYQRLNVAGRFGIAFHPHMDVCGAAAAGEARCNARVITDDKGTPLATPDVSAQVTPKVLPAGYGPAQFHAAYHLPTTAAGTPTIGIVDAYNDPNIENDLATYSAMYGLPSCTTANGCFKKVSQTGSTRYPSSNAGWSLEMALDVEVAHATCQNCKILLVEASSNSFSNLLAAEDYATAHATVVSNSWGGGEFSQETLAAYDGHFNRPGVPITVSAGDSGYGVEYPAASRYVTAVGGTSLFFNTTTGSYTESTWSGTGSGCSAYESKPAQQTDAGCAHRTVADVSADADPNTGAAVYDSVRYYGMSGWFEVGGTSLASPLVAATYALSGNVGSNTLASNAIPYLPGSASYLNDITSGSNGSCSIPYLCTAGLGYDGPTGLGTPNGIGAF